MLKDFHIFSQCKHYKVKLWECPNFLFLIMGLITIVSILLVYALGNRFINEPAIVILIILALTTVLFVVSFIITQSFEKLAQANLMKSEFIRIASHQLRSPITNINWSIDILRSGKLGQLSEKQTEYFKILKENSQRMADLVRDLLIVSKLEEGSLLTQKKEVLLEPIITNLISRFEPFIIASNTKINFDCEKNLPSVFVDANQMEIVIENLLDNAIRYIKNKGQVNIKLKKHDKNLYFEIQDNGIGIPKKDHKFIFQKFFRSENAAREQTQGTGLGLFIAKSIIEKFGGKIGFKSEENKGSTFYFTLPINKKLK